MRGRLTALAVTFGASHGPGQLMGEDRESAQLFTLATKGGDWLLVCSGCETEFMFALDAIALDAAASTHILGLALEHRC